MSENRSLDDFLVAGDDDGDRDRERDDDRASRPGADQEPTARTPDGDTADATERTDAAEPDTPTEPDDGTGVESEPEPEPEGRDGEPSRVSEPAAVETEDGRGEPGDDGVATAAIDDDTDAINAADDTDESAVEPLATTYRWSPDDDCPACGAPAERQWRDGDRYVCADCKEW